MNLPKSTRSLVHVAVGVIRDAQHRVLVARRAAHLHQGGLWEFPGGKVESGETVVQALVRELREELDITPLTIAPLIRIHHHYPDKSVLLDVHEVTEYTGEPRGLQQQPLQWVTVDDLPSYDFPAANQAIMTALRMPRVMLVTGAWQDQTEFEQRLERALQRGIRLVQLRAPMLAQQRYMALFARTRELCEGANALLLANTTPEIWQTLGRAHGLHLTSSELKRCRVRPVDRSMLLGASCHSVGELDAARQLGVDYVIIGHVEQTTTHPGVPSMGYARFAELAQASGLPVFAIGGMSRATLPHIRELGGYGIAAISAEWK